MLRPFLNLIIGSLFLACALTPFVCDLIIYLNGSLPWPYSRIFDRVAMLSVVIFLYLNRKHFSLGAVRKFLSGEVGRTRWSNLLIGVAISLGSSFLMFLYLLKIGIVEIDLRETWYYVRKVPIVILAAFLVSLIEEGFFRVICLQTAKQKVGFVLAAVLVSLLYASVHFIAPLKSFHYLQGEYLAGFVYLSAVLGSVFRAELLPAFAGLFIVGIVLAFAIERTKSIYVCLGLHAGWVMAVKLVGYTSSVNLAFDSSLARRYVLVAYPATWVALIAVFVLIYFIFSNRTSQT